jgi:CubicO group peptidase (beta-lactamase class C family)
MLCFENPGELLDWSGTGWDDYDAITQRIAASPPAWVPGTRIGYHGISFGWLLQELVRRITGDTLGTFFAREVAQPLDVDLFIGTGVEIQQRMADIVTTAERPGWIARLAGRSMQKTVQDPHSALAQASVTMHGRFIDGRFLNLEKARAAEIPAVNGTGDARGLARVYAMLAQGGELDGTRIVSRESISLFRQKAASGRTAVWPRSGLMRLIKPPQMRYGLGYEGNFGAVTRPRQFGPGTGAFGHLGAGGQIGFADPEQGIAAAFTRSHFSGWAASTALIEALYAATER